MRELEGQLQRLRQVLLDMLTNPADITDWTDWEERFHAAFLYLHQTGVLFSRPEIKFKLENMLLSPSVGASEQQLQGIPDNLLRTKLDRVEYSTGESLSDSQGISERAKLLLARLRSHDHITAPKSKTVGSHPHDYSLIKLLYAGCRS
jgi:hypothetical protein